MYEQSLKSISKHCAGYRPDQMGHGSWSASRGSLLQSNFQTSQPWALFSEAIPLHLVTPAFRPFWWNVILSCAGEAVQVTVLPRPPAANEMMTKPAEPIKYQTATRERCLEILFLPDKFRNLELQNWLTAAAESGNQPVHGYTKCRSCPEALNAILPEQRSFLSVRNLHLCLLWS